MTSVDRARLDALQVTQDSTESWSSKPQQVRVKLHPTARSSKREVSNNEINKVMQAKFKLRSVINTQHAPYTYNKIHVHVYNNTSTYIQ